MRQALRLRPWQIKGIFTFGRFTDVGEVFAEILLAAHLLIVMESANPFSSCCGGQTLSQHFKTATFRLPQTYQASAFVVSLRSTSRRYSLYILLLRTERSLPVKSSQSFLSVR